jgi:hypothetical protein
LGKILFPSGDTIECQLTYSPLVPGGLLKTKVAEGMKTFSPSQIRSFWFYDYKKELAFFEVLHDNPIYSIVGERTIKISKGNYDPWTAFASTYTSTSVRKNYITYLLDLTAWKFHKLNTANIYKLMHDKNQELKIYIKKNHLKLKKFQDCAKVINEYSRLKASDLEQQK